MRSAAPAACRQQRCGRASGIALPAPHGLGGDYRIEILSMTAGADFSPA
jgi:hypothetical protein